MRRVPWLLAVVAFLLNPAFACSDEPGFQFGAAEMRAAVEGDWSFTITPDGGAATQVTVAVAQGAAPATAARAPGFALVRAAYACGNRTLVKSAGACVETSGMPLEVAYVSGDESFASATLSGWFNVVGLQFAVGFLDLRIGPYQVLATVNADGTLAESRLGPQGASGALTVSRP